jgi:hypothetical protein
MGAGDAPVQFHIHTLVAASDERMLLLSPDRVGITGSCTRLAG